MTEVSISSSPASFLRGRFWTFFDSFPDFKKIKREVAKKITASPIRA
jgi:hypothetical protein